jgi:hypothetical protein
MFHVHDDLRNWRSRWPWKWLFPLKVAERYCRKCGFPYSNRLPAEVASYRANDVSVQVFPAGNNRRGELVVRVGRWRSSWGRPYLSDFIPESELDDLASATSQALDLYRARTTNRRARR